MIIMGLSGGRVQFSYLFPWWVWIVVSAVCCVSSRFLGSPLGWFQVFLFRMSFHVSHILLVFPSFVPLFCVPLFACYLFGPFMPFMVLGIADGLMISMISDSVLVYINGLFSVVSKTVGVTHWSSGMVFCVFHHCGSFPGVGLVSLFLFFRFWKFLCSLPCVVLCHWVLRVRGCFTFPFFYLCFLRVLCLSNLRGEV